MEAAHVVCRSKGYAVVGNNLNKRSASGILMKCVSQNKEEQSYEKFTMDLVATTLLQEHWLARHIDQASSGQ